MYSAHGLALVYAIDIQYGIGNWSNQHLVKPQKPCKCWYGPVHVLVGPEVIYRGVGNSSRAPFNAVVCPQTMRTSANCKGVDLRSRQKEAFPPPPPHIRYMVCPL